MKVYLAARFSLKQYAKALSIRLEDAGIEVTSRWLDEPPMPNEGQEKFKRETAFVDLDDMNRADMLVLISDDLDMFASVPAQWATGARHFEAGYAFAKGKPIVCVGDRDNLFYHLPNVTHVKTIDELVRFLSPVEVH